MRHIVNVSSAVGLNLQYGSLQQKFRQRDGPSHPPELLWFGMVRARFAFKTGGWVLNSAPICNTLLELSGFSGRDNGAFTAYLCTFSMRLA